MDENSAFLSILDSLADSCRQITEYAQTKGIKTMVENHGIFCEDSERIEMLVKRVDNKNFGVQVDFGNFLFVDENPVDAVKRCAPFAYNAHVKDFIFKSAKEWYPLEEGFAITRGKNRVRGTILGHGVVPIKECFDILKESGYDGYLTLEFEGCERLDYALEMGKKYLDGLLSKTE